MTYIFYNLNLKRKFRKVAVVYFILFYNDFVYLFIMFFVSSRKCFNCNYLHLGFLLYLFIKSFVQNVFMYFYDYKGIFVQYTVKTLNTGLTKKFYVFHNVFLPLILPLKLMAVLPLNPKPGDCPNMKARNKKVELCSLILILKFVDWDDKNFVFEQLYIFLK